MSAAAKPVKEEFETWIRYTVFVRRPGDKNPWYKHAGGDRITVLSTNQDKAMHQAERELAKAMARRFHLIDAGAAS